MLNMDNVWFFNFRIFILVLALFLENSSAQSGVVVQCSDGGEVNFKFTYKRTLKVPQYRLDREARSTDGNCRGTIEINPGEKGDHAYHLVELGSDVFQNLEYVDTINLQHHWFDYSKRAMYKGSPAIKSMNLFNNYFPRLDKSVEFPETLEKLYMARTDNFAEIKKEFFDLHPSLTEIDISEPLSAYTFAFEDRIFQGVTALNTIIMHNVPIDYLERKLLANTPTLKNVDMTNWRRLTAVEQNAFGGVVLDELNLSRWPFEEIDDQLFAGASIKKLIMHSTRIETLKPRSFANLKDAELMDFVGTKLTSIEAGAFQDFFPKENFELKLSKDLLCCTANGISELSENTNGLLINGNNETYSCLQPNKTQVSFPFGSDPTVGLPCCDTKTHYYDIETNSCQKCTVPENCLDSLDNVCSGTKFECLDCAVSYFPSQRESSEEVTSEEFFCASCMVPENCTQTAPDCAADGLLDCEICEPGLAWDEESRVCSQCLEPGTTSCIEFSSTACIEGTLELQCLTCQEGSQLDVSTGRCQTVENNTLPTGTVLGIAIPLLLIVAGTIVGVLFFVLRRRKIKKTKKLHKMFGIGSESPLEIEAEEFREDLVADYLAGGKEPKDSRAIETKGDKVKDKNDDDYLYVNTPHSEYRNHIINTEYHNNVKDNDAIANAESEYHNNVAESEYHNGAQVNSTGVVNAPAEQDAVAESEYCNNATNEYSNDFDVDTPVGKNDVVESEYCNHATSEYSNTFDVDTPGGN